MLKYYSVLRIKFHKILDNVLLVYLYIARSNTHAPHCHFSKQQQQQFNQFKNWQSPAYYNKRVLSSVPEGYK